MMGKDMMKCADIIKQFDNQIGAKLVRTPDI